METEPTDPRPRRRLLRVCVAAIAAAALAVVALPWALNSRAGRQWLVGRGNRAMSPGGFGLTTLEFSWFGPTRMTGFVIRDARGRPLVSAPRATWDRTLGQVLFGRPRLGTLRLDRAVILAERAPDGTIDLYQTLRPVIGLDPATSARIVVRDGSLRVRGAGLAEPVAAEHAEITVDVTPAPGPVTWKVRLANGDPAAPRNALAVDGRYAPDLTHPEGPFDVEVHASGRDWPLSLGGDRVSASGRLDGAVSANRRGGRWSLAGDASVARVEAAGAWLAGDRLRLDRVRGTWDADQTAAGWSVHRLELTSPLATLKADGAVAAADAIGGSARLDGTVDLAALAAQLPHALRLREGVTLQRGTAAVRVETRSSGGAPVLDLSARVSDLVARDRDRATAFTLRDPATLAARLKRTGGAVEVERLSAETPFLTVAARGDLARGVSLTGTVDLAGLQRQFRDLIDFGRLELAGRGGLKGTYRAESGRFAGGMDADLNGVRVAGVGPGPLEREAVHLEVSLDGPSSATGLPGGWEKVHLGLATGGASAGLTATSRADGRRGSATIELPVDLPGRETRVEGRIDARWDDAGVDLDNVSAVLRAAGDGPGPAPMVLAARGRYDRSRGVLTLSPTPGDGRPNVIALGEDGLRVSGLGGSGSVEAHGELGGDIAGLLPWLSSTPGGLRGRWSALATARSGDDGVQFGGRVAAEGLAFADGVARPGEAVRLDVRGLVSRDGRRLDLSEVAVRSRYAVLEASGRVDDPGGKRVADLRGRLAPDWDAINGWLAANVEPGARVTGRPRPLRLRGELRGGGRETLDGEVGVSIDGADVYGMKFGPTSVVLRARDGEAEIDPVDATVNGGKLHLEGGFRAGDGSGPAAFVLAKGSSLTDAAVNEEVSRRVLSFVAPVLDNATRVRGRVSATIDKAVVPLGDRAGLTVDGAVVFHDVAFVPGPLLDGLFELVGRNDRPSLTLDQPVSLTIADRRVYQRGLTVPIGNLSKVEVEGWVGFDRTLNLTASVPVLPTMLADRPLLGAVAGDARVRVPIRGTLQKPEVDREAFNLGMKDMGRSLLERGALQGAAGLLERMTRPRDPNEPPPLTPEERRARRQERRAERQSRRGRMPDN